MIPSYVLLLPKLVVRLHVSVNCSHVKILAPLCSRVWFLCEFRQSVTRRCVVILSMLRSAEREREITCVHWLISCLCVYHMSRMYDMRAFVLWFCHQPPATASPIPVRYDDSIYHTEYVVCVYIYIYMYTHIHLYYTNICIVINMSDVTWCHLVQFGTA